MIWLTWRQQRFEVGIAALLLVLAAAALVPGGLHMASVYSDGGVGACLAHPGGTGCNAIVDDFRARFQNAGSIIPWLNFLPGLFGILLAAPLVLEFEQGTFRLAWTQSVTRTRWLTVKLATICLIGLVATFALAALITWWRQPLDHLQGRMEANVFDFEGIVPYSYTLFAIALAIAIGVVTRRTIVATAAALLVFFVVRIVIQSWLREHYLAPITKVWRNGQPKPEHLDNAWILLLRPSDSLGHQLPFGDPTVMSCMSGPRAEIARCLNSHHVFNVATYHPASRFWLFQGIEAGIFFGLAALLLASAVWWVKHRVA